MVYKNSVKLYFEYIKQYKNQVILEPKLEPEDQIDIEENQVDFEEITENQDDFKGVEENQIHFKEIEENQDDFEKVEENRDNFKAVEENQDDFEENQIDFEEQTGIKDQITFKMEIEDKPNIDVIMAQWRKIKTKSDQTNSEVVEEDFTEEIGDSILEKLLSDKKMEDCYIKLEHDYIKSVDKLRRKHVYRYNFTI